jgi:hypothetical protein
MANHYKLSGHGIELSYTIGGNPSLPALTVTDNGLTQSYRPDEITVDMTDLGAMVSVPLTASVDGGGVRFGFFLPVIDVEPGQRAAVTTSGIIQIYSGPDKGPHRPSTWSCVHLHGIASRFAGPRITAVAA